MPIGAMEQLQVRVNILRKLPLRGRWQMPLWILYTQHRTGMWLSLTGKWSRPSTYCSHCPGLALVESNTGLWASCVKRVEWWAECDLRQSFFPSPSAGWSKSNWRPEMYCCLQTAASHLGPLIWKWFGVRYSVASRLPGSGLDSHPLSMRPWTRFLIWLYLTWSLP